MPRRSRFLNRSDHVESGFREMVVFAFDQAFKSLDRVPQVDELAGRAGENFCDVERLRQEALDLARTRNRQLVLFRQFVHAQDGDDILKRLVALQHLLHRARHRIMLLADDQRRQHPRRRIQRVHRWIDALGGDVARQHGGGVKMRERRRRRRVGKVIGRHVDRLHRGHRALCGGGDALLQRAHVGRQRRLIADRGRNAAEQRRHFRARLGEAEDVVDEEQHVLALIAEILGDGQPGEADAGARAWRLVHLAVNERAFGAFDRAFFRILVDAQLDHLVIEVVALASALAHAGEHRIAAVRASRSTTLMPVIRIAASVD